MNRETEELLNTADKRAVMVGLVTPNQSEERTKEYLDELAFLAETSEIVPEKRFIQAVQTPHSQTYVGQGKLEEIKQYIDDNGIEIAIFDDELSPRQLRNIEKKLCIQVLDRTSLILDIFAQRAQTSYAKTQVEMAHLQYMLPRLPALPLPWRCSPQKSVL